jgi:tetratricopeptide (TPR) repeat protein
MMHPGTTARIAIAGAFLGVLFLVGCAQARAGAPTASAMKGYLSWRAGDEAALTYYRQAVAEDPDSTVLREDLAQVLLERNQSEEALSVIDEGLTRRPGDGNLLFLRAKARLSLGRTAEAAEDAREAARKSGDTAAGELAVRLFLALERYEEALAAADEWAAADPADADAQFFLGEALAELNRGEEAARAYLKSVEIKPGHLQALLALGGLARSGNDNGKAREYFKRAMEANPHQVAARLALVELDLQEGKREEGLAALREAERWGGGDPRTRMRIGLFYTQMEAYPDAERVFSFLTQHAASDEAWFLLGGARLEMGSWQTAIEAFDHVSPQSEIYTDAVERKGAALDKLGRTEEAEGLLRGHFEEKPEDVDRLLAYASYLSEHQRKAEALALLEKRLAESDPSDPKLYYMAGSLHDELGAWEKGIDFMRRALAVDPEHAHAMNYIAYTYALKETRLEEAETLARRALELLPESGAIMDTLGWVLFKKGRLAEARVEMERAAGVTPADAVVREHLGDVYFALGERDLARAAYGEALRLDPDNKELPRKLEEVK